MGLSDNGAASPVTDTTVGPDGGARAQFDRLPPLYVVDGQPIHVGSLSETVEEVKRLLKKKVSFFICTLNLDHLVKLRRDAGFRRVYSRAAVVTADGFPITLLARLDRTTIHRTTGADLVDPLCAAAAENDLPTYLVGPTDETLVACVAKLRAKYPALKIHGYTAPPQNFDPHGDDARAIIEEIRSKDVRLCFVGLGAPKQELFCDWAADRATMTGFIPVGAALEFIAGTKRRAPYWMQRGGLEWLWRLGGEPTRLNQRYAESALLFLRLFVKRFRHEGVGRSR